MMKGWNTKMLTRGAVIAAAYIAVTLINPYSFGNIQVRVSEAMTLLPVLWPEATIGLTVGCFLSNVLGPNGIIDAVVGSLATLAAALLTRRLRANRWVAALPPILVNGVVIGAMLHIIADLPLLLTMLQVSIGQAIACYALGIPLLMTVKRLELGRG